MSRILGETMKNRTSVVIGAVLVVIGIFAIFNSIFHINLWNYIFPLLIIAFGVFIITRESSISENTKFIFKFIGEITKNGYWQVSSQEIWCFVGDMTFDFRQAEFPEGETEIKIIGFVTDIDVIKSDSAALKFNGNSFISSSKVNGDKQDHFLSPFVFQDSEYTLTNKKVNLKVWSFVGEHKIN
jgi:predicted membrane protein